MRLFINLATGELCHGINNERRLERIELKRGDGVELDLRFFRAGVLEELPEGAVVTFGAKVADDYDGDPVILGSDFSLAGDDETPAAPRYVGTISLNTEELDTAIGSNAWANLMAEVTWVVGDAEPLSTGTFSLRAHNDIVRGDEGTPLALPDPEEWTSARAVRFDEEQTLTSEEAAQARENIGLGNVDNTSDTNKPVSIAQADAIASAAEEATTPPPLILSSPPQEYPLEIYVSGTLSDGVSPVTFPVLEFAGMVNDRPRYSGSGATLSRPSSLWTLTRSGASTGVWTSSSDVYTPDLATGWTPQSPATGTPVIDGDNYTTPGKLGQSAIVGGDQVWIKSDSGWVQSGDEVSGATVRAAIEEDAEAARTSMELGASDNVTFASVKIGNNIATESADFTLSESTHAGKYVRLTKSGSTQTITLPGSGIATGSEFAFFRATSQSLAFSGGTVAGSARLADVVENSAFALKCTGAGTYDFI